MDETRALRVAGWSGIVFSILSLIVLPLIGGGALPPPLGATGAELAAFYSQHRTGFLIGNYLGIVAFVPAFVQLAVLAARVRRLEGPSGFLASLLIATGSFAYAVFGCSLVAFQALPFLSGPPCDPALGAVGTLGAVWFALDGLAALPLVLALAWATRATRALPGWFVPVSGAMAALALAMSLGALTATPRWLAGGGALTGAGFVAFFAWTFAWGVAMLRLKPAHLQKQVLPMMVVTNGASQ